MKSVSKLRSALAQYRSALRSGEDESDELRTVGDDAMASIPAWAVRQ